MELLKHKATPFECYPKYKNELLEYYPKFQYCLKDLFAIQIFIFYCLIIFDDFRILQPMFYFEEKWKSLGWFAGFIPHMICVVPIYILIFTPFVLMAQLIENRYYQHQKRITIFHIQQYDYFNLINNREKDHFLEDFSGQSPE